MVHPQCRSYLRRRARDALGTPKLQPRFAQIMLTCPHCHAPIRIRELPHQGLFKSHRVCPACAGSFIVDRKTRQWQAVFIVVAL